MPSALDGFVGKEVVLDTSGPIVYLGRLTSADEAYITLEDTDVHDSTQGASTKEVYILEAKKHGVRRNRRRVLIRSNEVISISLLEEVIEY